MSDQRWNQLGTGESIRHLVRITGAVSVDISYWKRGDGEDTPARPYLADYGTVSVVTDLNEVIPIHNFTADGKGNKTALRCIEEIMMEIYLFNQELTA